MLIHINQHNAQGLNALKKIDTSLTRKKIHWPILLSDSASRGKCFIRKAHGKTAIILDCVVNIKKPHNVESIYNICVNRRCV